MSDPLRALPWRIGATSYVLDGGLVENAAHLAAQQAGVVSDMQLVLFDLPGGPSNLPDAATIAALARIGQRGDLSYTVHLLSDLAALHGPHDWTTPLAQAQDVIARTAPLAPHAYVLHLDGRAPRGGSMPLDAWQGGVADALGQVATWAGGSARLAVENLEGYAPDWVDAAVSQAGTARCVDVGHLWLDGHDPLPWLAAAQARLAVVHLHGVAGRDHLALDATPPAQLDAVMAALLRQRFRGVLTLEVFGADDFAASLAALRASAARITEGTWTNG